ncbi:MAG: MmgE/PrpD family protein [Beijerinckiaceae bacterium]
MAIHTPGVVPASQLVTHQQPEWLAQWAQFSARTGFDDLPNAVQEHAQLVILDCIGAMIAGQAEPEITAASLRMNAGKYQAAFIGGVAGTTLEIDEGNQYARGHPAIHVVPALLAVAAQQSVTGRDFILAAALGYEIGARIGIASKLRITMHPHGTWGVVGAALGVAKLACANAAQIAAVINVASSLGLTTSRRTMLEGATVRNSYAGFSNMLGMMAWDMVLSGFTGEADGVGSVYGGIAAEQWTPQAMTAELGQRWEIARNYFKRHAACRYNHGALDALEQIIAAHGSEIEPDRIARIDVDTYVWAAQLDHPEPQSMLAAKFSMPFSLATRIVQGHSRLDAFRDAARLDARARNLARQVTVNEDQALTARLPGERPARVTVHFTDGTKIMREVNTNKGDTENPYSAAEVIQKFHEVTQPVIGAERSLALTDAVMRLRDLPSLETILHLSRMS